MMSPNTKHWMIHSLKRGWYKATHIFLCEMYVKSIAGSFYHPDFFFGIAAGQCPNVVQPYSANSPEAFVFPKSLVPYSLSTNSMTLFIPQRVQQSFRNLSFFFPLSPRSDKINLSLHTKAWPGRGTWDCTFEGEDRQVAGGWEFRSAINSAHCSTSLCLHHLLLFLKGSHHKQKSAPMLLMASVALRLYRWIHLVTLWISELLPR